MSRSISILIFLIIFPLTSISADRADFEGAEKAINLLSRACLSSSKISYDIKGNLDLSLLKRLSLSGHFEGDVKFNKIDILSYLPNLKDELQQAERDAIRKCINPLLPNIFDQYGVLKKK